MKRPIPVLSMRFTPARSKTIRRRPWSSISFSTVSMRSPSGPRITLPSSEITAVPGATSFGLISKAMPPFTKTSIFRMGLFAEPIRIPDGSMILAAAMNPEAWSGVEDTIGRLRRGDPDALAALISRYQHRLYRYLLRLLREPAAADDLFQQTWVRVMEKIGRYDARRNFEAWLF